MFWAKSLTFIFPPQVVFPYKPPFRLPVNRKGNELMLILPEISLPQDRTGPVRDVILEGERATWVGWGRFSKSLKENNWKFSTNSGAETVIHAFEEFELVRILVDFMGSGHRHINLSDVGIGNGRRNILTICKRHGWVFGDHIQCPAICRLFWT